jgi:hypothetical protein
VERLESVKKCFSHRDALILLAPAAVDTEDWASAVAARTLFSTPAFFWLLVLIICVPFKLCLVLLFLGFLFDVVLMISGLSKAQMQGFSLPCLNLPHATTTTSYILDYLLQINSALIRSLITLKAHP